MATETDWAFGAGGFAKLYGDRLSRSSLLDTAVATRWVFVYMLATADAQGRFRCATIGALARAAAVSLPEARRAIKELQAPDPDSTTAAHEGRRVEPIAGGWKVLNYAFYRDYRTQAQEGAAERKRRQRDRAGKGSRKRRRDKSRDVTGSHAQTSDDRCQITDSTSLRSVEPPNPQAAADERTPRINELVTGKRRDLEREYYALLAKIAGITGEDPTEIAGRVGAWKGTRKLNPASMGDDRLLNTVLDLRAELKRRAQPQAGAPCEDGPSADELAAVDAESDAEASEVRR